MAELMWNNDAECGLLSCLTHSPKLIDYVSTLVDEDTFHGFNKYLYLLLLRLNDEGKLFGESDENNKVLRIEISEERELDIEDDFNLSNILEFVPTPTHYEYYLKIIRDKRILKGVVNGLQVIEKECYKFKANPHILSEQMSLLMKEAKAYLNKKNDIHKVGDLSELIKEEINVREEGDERKFRIKTGFKTINKFIPSLEPGDMFVIAARPSLGKTSLLIDILLYVAFYQKVACGFFSLEMPTLAILFRIIQSLSFQNIQEHFDKPTRESWTKIAAAIKLMQECNNIYIDDTAGLDIGEFRRKCRIMKELGVELIGVDYIQLMTAAVKGRQNRENELSYISSEIKGTAKEFGLRIIVLAQLNRKPEQRKGRKPLISDLRESGSIEQDADMIGLLSRDHDEKNKIINCVLDIAKNRNGEPGKAHLAFVKHISKFTNPFYGTNPVE